MERAGYVDLLTPAEYHLTNGLIALLYAEGDRRENLKNEVKRYGEGLDAFMKGLAFYLIKRGELEKAMEVAEETGYLTEVFNESFVKEVYGYLIEKALEGGLEAIDDMRYLYSRTGVDYEEIDDKKYVKVMKELAKNGQVGRIGILLEITGKDFPKDTAEEIQLGYKWLLEQGYVPMALKLFEISDIKIDTSRESMKKAINLAYKEIFSKLEIYEEDAVEDIIDLYKLTNISPEYLDAKKLFKKANEKQVKELKKIFRKMPLSEKIRRAFL